MLTLSQLELECLPMKMCSLLQIIWQSQTYRTFKLFQRNGNFLRLFSFPIFRVRFITVIQMGWNQKNSLTSFQMGFSPCVHKGNVHTWRHMEKISKLYGWTSGPVSQMWWVWSIMLLHEFSLTWYGWIYCNNNTQFRSFKEKIVFFVCIWMHIATWLHFSEK